MFKTILASLLIFSGTQAFAQSPGLVTLISRYIPGGSYEATATYSFRAMTHDVEKTRNNWDLLLEAREDLKEDFFSVNTVTDDRSEIVDLTANSSGDCRLARSIYNNGKNDDIPVIEGHTYMINGNDRDGSVRVTFKVMKHVKGILTVLSNIQVLSQSGYPNLQKAQP